MFPFTSRKHPVDTSTSSSSTRFSNQRKTFHDGTYFWAFYFHGGHTYYTYSSNGFTWTNGYTRLFTTSTVRNPSVWFYSSGSTKYVYAVGDNDVSDTTVVVKKGTISGSTITWDPDYFPTVGSTGLSYKIPFICRDSSGHLWIVSNVMETNYNLAAVRSNSIDDVSSWGSYTLLMSSDITNNYIYGVVVPLDNEDVYALWYADGSIDGKRYTSGSWGSIENINTTTASVSTKAPSVVVDSSYYVNLVFSNSTGSIIYRQRTSSWGTASVVTTTTNNVYPSITLQTTTGDFYTLWIDSSAQIAGKKYSSGFWTSMSGIDVSTITKNYLSTPYTTSSDGGISWIWGQGGTTPYEVKFARIPEFPDFIAVTIVMLLLIIVLNRRRLRFLR